MSYVRTEFGITAKEISRGCDEGFYFPQEGKGQRKASTKLSKCVITTGRAMPGLLLCAMIVHLRSAAGKCVYLSGRAPPSNHEIVNKNIEMGVPVDPTN